MIFNPVYGGNASANLGSKTITANGTYLASSDNLDGYDEVIANVPNTYAAADEGKVVNNGALASQTAATYTTNDTYDTTLINSVTVNVSGGGGATLITKAITANGTYDASDDNADGYSEVTVNVPDKVLDKSMQNYFLAGNCYVKSGRVTGFTSAASLWYPRNSNNANLDVNWSQPFVIHTRFKLANTYNGGQTLYGCYTSNVYFVLPTCEVRIDNFWFGFTTNGTSWTNEATITSVPVAANKEYQTTVVYNGTKISITVTDGTNTGSAEITPSGAMYNNTSRRIAFGGIAQNASLIGRYIEFDQDDTYIESNGSLIWGVKA